MCTAPPPLTPPLLPQQPINRLSRLSHFHFPVSGSSLESHLAFSCYTTYLWKFAGLFMYFKTSKSNGQFIFAVFPILMLSSIFSRVHWGNTFWGNGTIEVMALIAPYLGIHYDDKYYSCYFTLMKQVSVRILHYKPYIISFLVTK